MFILLFCFIYGIITYVIYVLFKGSGSSKSISIGAAHGIAFVPSLIITLIAFALLKSM